MHAAGYADKDIAEKFGCAVQTVWEWRVMREGRGHKVYRSPKNPSRPFHPPYDEMRKVMREVTAGLLELCASVAEEIRRESKPRLSDDAVGSGATTFRSAIPLVPKA
jgi:hypothetical protein